jgi:hypothetical protein
MAAVFAARRTGHPSGQSADKRIRYITLAAKGRDALDAYFSATLATRNI